MKKLPVLYTKNLSGGYLKMAKIPAEIVARLLLIFHAKNSDQEKGICLATKIDEKILQKLSGRKSLTEDFLAELDEFFADIGWHFGFIYNEENTFYIHHDSIIEDWEKIDTQNATNLLQQFESSIASGKLNDFFDRVEEEFEEYYGDEEE